MTIPATPQALLSRVVESELAKINSAYSVSQTQNATGPNSADDDDDIVIVGEALPTDKVEKRQGSKFFQPESIGHLCNKA